MAQPAKKRRGRPALPEAQRRSRNFTFRSRSNLREKLQKAAEQNDRSISEEIEARLQRSFDHDEIFGGAEIRDIALTAAAKFRDGGIFAAKLSDKPLRSTSAWMKDPVCFRSALISALEGLIQYQPKDGLDVSETLQAIHQTLDRARARISAPLINKLAGDKR